MGPPRSRPKALRRWRQASRPSSARAARGPCGRGPRGPRWGSGPRGRLDPEPTGLGSSALRASSARTFMRSSIRVVRRSSASSARSVTARVVSSSSANSSKRRVSRSLPPARRASAWRSRCSSSVSASSLGARGRSPVRLRELAGRDAHDRRAGRGRRRREVTEVDAQDAEGLVRMKPDRGLGARELREVDASQQRFPRSPAGQPRCSQTGVDQGVGAAAPHGHGEGSPALALTVSHRSPACSERGSVHDPSWFSTGRTGPAPARGAAGAASPGEVEAQSLSQHLVPDAPHERVLAELLGVVLGELLHSSSPTTTGDLEVDPGGGSGWGSSSRPGSRTTGAAALLWSTRP